MESGAPSGPFLVSRTGDAFIVRGEILGFMKDEQLRKHLPRMFSLIKNESWGIANREIESGIESMLFFL